MYQLIAVLLADGSVDKKRNTVSFTEDKDLVERFIKEFQEINGLKINWKMDLQRNSLRARAYSKELVTLLLKEVSIFRTRPFNIHPISSEKRTETKPKPRIPKVCLTNLEVAREFLKYYISCDGGPEFSVYRRKSGQIQLHVGVKIGCKNSFLRKQLLELLKKFGIEGLEKQDGIIIRSAKSIAQFEKEIGFLEESKVRKGKRFKGFSKNNVVKLMLLCSLLTKQGNWINKNFTTLSELENFLLICLNLIKSREKGKLLEFLKTKTGMEININSFILIL
jgi:hypothetical protein